MLPSSSEPRLSNEESNGNPMKIQAASHCLELPRWCLELPRYSPFSCLWHFAPTLLSYLIRLCPVVYMPSILSAIRSCLASNKVAPPHGTSQLWGVFLLCILLVCSNMIMLCYYILAWIHSQACDRTRRKGSATKIL